MRTRDGRLNRARAFGSARRHRGWPTCSHVVFSRGPLDRSHSEFEIRRPPWRAAVHFGFWPRDIGFSSIPVATRMTDIAFVAPRVVENAAVGKPDRLPSNVSTGNDSGESWVNDVNRFPTRSCHSARIWRRSDVGPRLVRIEPLVVKMANRESCGIGYSYRERWLHIVSKRHLSACSSFREKRSAGGSVNTAVPRVDVELHRRA